MQPVQTFPFLWWGDGRGWFHTSRFFLSFNAFSLFFGACVHELVLWHVALINKHLCHKEYSVKFRIYNLSIYLYSPFCHSLMHSTWIHKESKSEVRHLPHGDSGRGLRNESLNSWLILLFQPLAVLSFFFLKMIHVGTTPVHVEVPAPTHFIGKIFQHSVLGTTEWGNGLWSLISCLRWPLLPDTLGTAKIGFCAYHFSCVLSKQDAKQNLVCPY